MNDTLSSRWRDVSRFVQRTMARRRQRYAVGRAYDMAREIGRYVGTGGDMLDVGCGDGFISHHLRALNDLRPMGIDVLPAAAAPIPYQRFDGARLGFDDESFDAVLLCYVLHHCADPARLLGEARRVLRSGGRIVVYEDVPVSAFDRLMCLRHDLAWRGRSSTCTFQQAAAWRGLAEALGLRVVVARELSRLRDVTHPVRRVLFVLEKPASCGPSDA